MQKVAVVVKGYPRLSETFIAQEILALERLGLPLEIWSLRHPTDGAVHAMNKAIKAKVVYLPEYLYRGPLRVLTGFFWSLRQPRFFSLLKLFWNDLKRDFTANRGRRLGQAFVMAKELPNEIRHIHVHYLHTPASVVRYAAFLTDRSWSFSAHAKDIWTTPDWEKREKISAALWGVTCTRQGFEHLNCLVPEKTTLVYHGLDLSRFPEPILNRSNCDGSDPSDPIRILSVGRAVAKKGFDDLLRALAALPRNLHWRFVHIGGGELLKDLKREADSLGIADKVAFMGAKDQAAVIAMLRESDLFVLPSKEAPSGDRDGLPNVLMEAASQKRAIVATDFAGIPEFIRNGQEGDLTPPGDWEALSNALNLSIRDPARRERLAEAAYERLRRDFSLEGGIADLVRRFQNLSVVR